MSSTAVILSAAPVTRSATKRLAAAVDTVDMKMSKKLKRTRTKKALFDSDEVTDPSDTDGNLIAATFDGNSSSLNNVNEATESVENKPVIDIFVMGDYIVDTDEEEEEDDDDEENCDDDDIPPLEEVPVDNASVELSSDTMSPIHKATEVAVIGQLEETSIPSKPRVNTIRIPPPPVPARSPSETDDDDVAAVSLCGSDVDKDDPMFTKPRQRVIKHRRTSYDLMKEYINPGTLTEKELKRIAGISIRGNQFTYRYPVSNVPLMAKWGTTGGISAGYEDKTRFLTVYNSPIRVTVTGTVSGTFFYGPNGDPLPRVSIGIAPLRAQDLASYNTLLNNKSNPPLNTERDIIYAGRFQTQRIRDRQAPICVPYHRVYDMQTGPTRKHAPKSAAMIAKNDIVMLECNVIRYRPAPKAGSNGKRSGRGWDEWLVGLELVDILYLHQAPEVEMDEVVREVEGDGEEY